MSETEYIEISSTNRDRNRHPNPSNYEVQQVWDTSSNLYARDPVCDSAPLFTFLLPLALGTVVDNNTNNTTSFIVSFNNDSRISYSNNPCFYINHPFEILHNGTIIEKGIINKLEYITTSSNLEIVRITTKFALKSIPIKDHTFVFKNPTDITNGIFYVPNSEPKDNFYNGYFLWNDSQFSSGVQKDQCYREIKSYNASLNQIGVDTPPPGLWMTNHTYSIRKVIPTTYIITDFVKGDEVDNQLTKPTSLEHINLNNSYFRFYDQEETYRINDQEDENDRIYTQPKIPTTAIANKWNVELLSYTRDNFTPLNNLINIYNNEAIYFGVKLTQLTLPNQPLKNGGRITNYPYVNVSLSNNDFYKHNNVISNHPKSPKYLFQVYIDTSVNCNSPFIRFKGDGVEKKIRFNLHKNLFFSVYLPDGTLFETLEQERFSPSIPNPNIQNYAIFSLKRL